MENNAVFNHESCHEILLKIIIDEEKYLVNNLAKNRNKLKKEGCFIHWYCELRADSKDLHLNLSTFFIVHTLSRLNL